MGNTFLGISDPICNENDYTFALGCDCKFTCVVIFTEKTCFPEVLAAMRAGQDTHPIKVDLCPLPSKLGLYKTVRTRIWSWLSGKTKLFYRVLKVVSLS
jgi:hypothetical protein